MGENSGKAREISLGDDFGDVAISVNGVRVEIRADGSVVHPAANDAGARASLEIGAVALAGEHKGEIYGGTYPTDNKPIWFLEAPKLMDHYKAAAWAKEQGGSLPTRKQGDYLTTLKGKGGAFTEIFNRGGPYPAGHIWLAEPYTVSKDGAWCQRLRDGDQNGSRRGVELPVLCVRR